MLECMEQRAGRQESATLRERRRQPPLTTPQGWGEYVFSLTGRCTTTDQASRQDLYGRMSTVSSTNVPVSSPITTFTDQTGFPLASSNGIP